MKILNLNRVTSGKRHGWYNTDLGFMVRNPLFDIKIVESLAEIPKQETKFSLWQRIFNWIKKLFIK